MFHEPGTLFSIRSETGTVSSFTRRISRTGRRGVAPRRRRRATQWPPWRPRRRCSPMPCRSPSCCRSPAPWARSASPGSRRSPRCPRSWPAPLPSSRRRPFRRRACTALAARAATSPKCALPAARRRRRPEARRKSAISSHLISYPRMRSARFWPTIGGSKANRLRLPDRYRTG